jgi:2-amino-4-hydroxy-6-hydroxymethyldihydropteridine diphosphokinase
MTDQHKFYLSLGSNLDAEIYLPKAVLLLRKAGELRAISSVWETRAVGSEGPNFLNACVLFLSPLLPYELKEQGIRPIEAELGRVRSADKNAPRTIDIDILSFDETPLNVEFWDSAFVAVPLAELIPEFIHPLRREKLIQVAAQLQSQVWIVKREDVAIS